MALTCIILISESGSVRDNFLFYYRIKVLQVMFLHHIFVACSNGGGEITTLGHASSQIIFSSPIIAYSQHTEKF